MNEQPGPGSSEKKQTRISILKFPARTPTAPQKNPVHQDPAKKIAQWSVPVKDFNPLMGRIRPVRLLKGKYSGTALLSYFGAYASGRFSVSYANYSDDGGATFLDGVETILVVLAPPLTATWSANLTSRGARHGYLRGWLSSGRTTPTWAARNR